MERRDIANKTEGGSRSSLGQHRTLQSISGSGGGSHMPDGNAKSFNQMTGNLNSDVQTQSSQSNVGTSHDAGNTQGQENERSTTSEGTANAGHDPQAPISESGQNTLRRNYGFGRVVSATGAFETAKDIMETLRNKHSILASELEVTDLVIKCTFSYLHIIKKIKYRGLSPTPNLHLHYVHTLFRSRG